MQKKFGIAVVTALLAAPVASRRRSTLSLSRLCDSGGTFLRRLRRACSTWVHLAPGSIVYYRVPPEYGVAPDYRYAMVNRHTVLVDPTTRRIVQIVATGKAPYVRHSRQTEWRLLCDLCF
jgi:hypothetical protein